MNKFQPWALPASIALLALSTLVGAVIIAVPLQNISSRPVTIDGKIETQVDGHLNVESMFGLTR